MPEGWREEEIIGKIAKDLNALKIKTKMVYTLSEGVEAPRSVGSLLRFAYKESVAHMRETVHEFWHSDEIGAPGISMGVLVCGGFILLPPMYLGVGIYEWRKAAKFDRKLERWLKEKKPPRDFNPELGLEGNLER